MNLFLTHNSKNFLLNYVKKELVMKIKSSFLGDDGGPLRDHETPKLELSPLK